MSTGEVVGGVAAAGARASGAIRTTTCRPPVLGPSVVTRPDVVDRLRAVASGTVVLITAAAGYGKTITAALWERDDPRPFAWVALDALDDDPAHLVAHVATALARQDLLDAEDLRFLSAPGRDPLVELVPVLAEILDRTEPFVLVVDDVHVLREPAALATLGSLVGATPCHGVIALLGRTQPVRGTARRRLSDTVVELRAPDLALDLDDARQVCDGLGVSISDPELADVVERTEGWAGGVHLAALALREGAGRTRPLVTGRNRLLADYLVEEVLDGLDDDVASFLEEASLISPMDAELLDEALDRHDSGQRLAQIEASGNLFLVPLDQEGTLYRFHHLFGELLESRLHRRDPLRLTEIHARAADALVRRGDVDRAVSHALGAGDRARAAALVQRDAIVLTMAGHAGLLARRLALLDDVTLTTDPDVAMARAWVAMADGDGAAVRRAVDDALRHDEGRPLPDGSTSVPTAIALLVGLLGEGGLEGVLRNTTIVVAAGDRWQAMAQAVRASALVHLGRHAEARADLTTSLEHLHPVPAFEAAALEYLAWLHVREGDLANAISSADAGRRVADRHDLHGVVPVLIIWCLDALVAARAGQRPRAEDDIAVAEASLDRIGDESPRTRVFAHQVLTEALHVLGDWAEARRHLREAERIHRQHPLSPWFDAEAVRLTELLGRGPAGTSLGVTPLTAAERRVLPHLATHLSLPQIAAELCVSRNTVKTHCVSLYRKMGVTSRAGAVAEARRLGLIDG